MAEEPGLIWQPSSAAGWYLSGNRPGQLRYWDGHDWTNHYAPWGPTGPEGPAEPDAAVDGQEGQPDRLRRVWIVAGVRRRSRPSW